MDERRPIEREEKCLKGQNEFTVHSSLIVPISIPEASRKDFHRLACHEDPETYYLQLILFFLQTLKGARFPRIPRKPRGAAIIQLRIHSNIHFF